MRQMGKKFLEELGIDSTELELEELNDQSQLQQMMMQLQQRMMGGGEQAGNPLMPQQKPPQGGGGQGGSPNGAPQNIGRPVDDGGQGPGANQAARMVSGG